MYKATSLLVFLFAAITFGTAVSAQQPDQLRIPLSTEYDDDAYCWRLVSDTTGTPKELIVQLFEEGRVRVRLHIQLEPSPTRTAIIYDYDEQGNLVLETWYESCSNLASARYEYSYDAAGRLISQRIVDIHNSIIVSESGETSVESTDLPILECELMYDDEGRLQVNRCSHRVTEWQYDDQGRVTSATITHEDRTETRSFTYNERGLLVEETATVDGALTFRREREWGEMGLLTAQREDEDGDGSWDRTASFTNDADGNRHRESVDTDGDGEFEHVLTYDFSCRSVVDRGAAMVIHEPISAIRHRLDLVPLLSLIVTDETQDLTRRAEAFATLYEQVALGDADAVTALERLLQSASIDEVVATAEPELTSLETFAACRLDHEALEGLRAQMVATEAETGEEAPTESTVTPLATERGGLSVLLGGSEDQASAEERQAILTTIRELRPALRSCYEDQLAEIPSLEGRMLIQFSIDLSGAVTDAQITEDTLENAQVEACVLEQFRSLDFSALSTTSVRTVNYPVVFERVVTNSGNPD